MNCEDAREARLDRASGPLEAEQEKAYTAHVERCAECRAFAAEIDSIEAGIEDTLGAAAGVEVARRFAPRSRWAPLGVAAALAVAAGAGWLAGRARDAKAPAVEGARVFALEKNTEITVEVREDPVKRTHGAVGASVVAVGVVSGAVLLKMSDGNEAAVRPGETAFASAKAPITVVSPAEQAAKQAEAEKKIASLEAALARSEGRAQDLERRLAAQASERAGGGSSRTDRPDGTKPGAGSEQPGTAVEGTPDDRVRALVAKFDWKAGTQALVAVRKAQASGQQSTIEPASYLALSKMNVIIAEIAKARKLDNPWQAYSDPLVLEAFYPAWLDALGVGLDETQVAALRRHVHDGAATEAKTAPPADERFIGTLARELEDKIAEDRHLESFLRREQLQRYYESIGDDPLNGAHIDRTTSKCTDVAALADTIVGDWKKTFELSPQATQGAQAVARKYAEAAVEIPLVDPTLDTGARRAAALRRTIAIARLQDRMERELAGLTVLSDAERARVQKGASYLHDLQLRK